MKNEMEILIDWISKDGMDAPEKVKRLVYIRIGQLAEEVTKGDE